MNIRFLFREIIHSRSQALVFIFCVMLSLVSIVAVNSFRRDVNESIIHDARQLHGGDVIIHSHHSFSAPLNDEFAELSKELGVSVIKTWEFYSVARRVDGEDSLLSNIKAVEKKYPHYGHVSLLSSRKFDEVLQPGKAIVGKSLLERLGLQVGDSLLLGDISLQIVDVITVESMRPVDFFNFGPRILVCADDLNKMGLVSSGSRVHYGALLKTSNDTQMEVVAKRLQGIAVISQERVTTYKSASSRIKRFFDNLLFFLSLVSVFTLLLAGIGMQSSLGALLRRKQKSFAIMRSLGATSWFLMSHYMVIVLLLSAIGCGLGIIGGALFEKSFILLFSGLLPDDIVLGISFQGIIENIIVGLLVVSFFTYIPLQGIRDVKPAKIFNKEGNHRSISYENFVAVGCGILLLGGLFVRQLDDVQTGLYFVAGVLGLIFIVFVLATLILKLLAKLNIPFLVLRQALRSLVRPGNATRPVIVTLASALAVLLSLYLIQYNLHATYISSYPADAPNLFCLDIQKHQKQQFLELVGEDTQLFPVIRARLIAINGKKIDRKVATIKRGDNLAREFNLTYRDELLVDEVLKAGDSLFGDVAKKRGVVSVSVLDSVAKMGEMAVGDLLDFNIQGVPLQAVVGSIRSRTQSMLYPFFYFVFQTADLQAAPQTFFGALKVSSGELSELENKIVNTFGNISTINVSETAAELGNLMEKLAVIVNFFASFSILAGGLILVGSILATRMERMREAVYYKVLGGGRIFILKVFFVENTLLAFFSSSCGMVVAQLGSWIVCRFFLKLEYSPVWSATLLMFLCTAILLCSLGLVSSMSIINRKPMQFLSEQG